MPSIHELISRAQTFAEPPSASNAELSAEAEARRILGICNACRYCEGYCAVFPAISRRLTFTDAEVHYLANLCHNCGACLYACQYAPPHEFAVNVPQTMARVRIDTYSRHVWPRASSALFQHNGLVVSIAAAVGILLFLVLALLRGDLWRVVPGAYFYAVFPHGLMASIFSIAFLAALVALVMTSVQFWRAIGPGKAGVAEVVDATAAVGSLRYLDGGHGEGCNNADDRFSLARRRWHHATFYGFLFCFLATCVATIYHYAFGLEAPYAYTSLPALLGIAGGLSILAGTLGLLVLNLRRNRLQGDIRQKPMEIAFIALLLLTSFSGLALAALRATVAMPMLLAVHSGIVVALFATLPYGKFAHAPMRAIALLKWSVERRRPNRVGLADN